MERLAARTTYALLLSVPERDNRSTTYWHVGRAQQTRWTSFSGAARNGSQLDSRLLKMYSIP